MNIREAKVHALRGIASEARSWVLGGDAGIFVTNADNVELSAADIKRVERAVHSICDGLLLRAERLAQKGSVK